MFVCLALVMLYKANTGKDVFVVYWLLLMPTATLVHTIGCLFNKYAVPEYDSSLVTALR